MISNCGILGEKMAQQSELQKIVSYKRLHFYTLCYLVREILFLAKILLSVGVAKNIHRRISNPSGLTTHIRNPPFLKF